MLRAKLQILCSLEQSCPSKGCPFRIAHCIASRSDCILVRLAYQTVRTCIHFAIFAAGIGMVLAHVPPAQPRRIGPAEIYPDPARTPGAANPQVTHRNIKDNICNPQWSTKLVRPPSEYTSKLKRKQLREYGDTVHQTRAELVNPSTGKLDTTRCLAHSDNMACYEEDHLIPLEDGGDPTDSGPSHITRTWAAQSWALARRMSSRLSFMTKSATTSPAPRKTPTYRRRLQSR